jgi:hypothetical protein
VPDPFAPHREFDVAPLESPVDPAEAARFRRSPEGRAGLRTMGREAVLAAVMWGVVALGIEFLIVVMPAMTFAMGGLPFVAIAIVLVAGPLLAWPMVRWILRRVRRERPPGLVERRLRIQRFAEANGFRYTPWVPRPPAIASVMTTGSDRLVWDRLTSPSLQVGNYRTGDQYNTAVAPDGWGYIALRLRRRVPHLLLLPKHTRRLSARAVVPVRGDQAMRLEGDFDRHFTLYAPSGYERDALYVITPDLMARLIDTVPGAIVEALDEQVTISLPRPFDLADPAQWAQIERLVATIGAKAARQTRRYADDRSPQPGFVATPGRRLRLGISIGSIVAVVWIVIHLLPLLRLL